MDITQLKSSAMKLSKNSKLIALGYRYEMLTKCNIKSASCTPNIDEPMDASLDPDQSLRSYRKLFCRRCLIYNCQLHTENIYEMTFVRKNNVAELKPFTEPCSSTCYLLMKMETNTQSVSSFCSHAVTISTEFIKVAFAFVAYLARP